MHARLDARNGYSLGGTLADSTPPCDPPLTPDTTFVQTMEEGSKEGLCVYGQTVDNDTRVSYVMVNATMFLPSLHACMHLSAKFCTHHVIYYDNAELHIHSPLMGTVPSLHVRSLDICETHPRR